MKKCKLIIFIFFIFLFASLLLPKNTFSYDCECVQPGTPIASGSTGWTCAVGIAVPGSCRTGPNGGQCCMYCYSAPANLCLYPCSGGYWQGDCGSGGSSVTAPNPPTISCNSSATGSNDRLRISWTNNANPVTYVDIHTSSSFPTSGGGFYNKSVSGSANTSSSTTAPTGFYYYNGSSQNTSSPLSLSANTTYYVRLFNGNHSTNATFNCLWLNSQLLFQ